MPSLEDLGLPEYQARAYRSLLRTGPTTARELSRASGVPMGRIYDVLADLEATELVRTQRASRPKKYAPVDPETGLSRLLEERRREAEAELGRYEAVVEALSDDLEANAAAEGRFYTVGIGPEEAFDLLLQRLGAATASIEMVVGEVSAQFDLGDVGARAAEAIDAALARGVSVSLLGSPDVVAASPTPVLERYADLAGREGYEARQVEGLTDNFTLVDRVEVCIEVTNPLAAEELLALIALRDAALAENLDAAFERRWAEADPVVL